MKTKLIDRIWKGRDGGICDEITLNKLPEATFALGWNNNKVVARA